MASITEREYIDRVRMQAKNKELIEAETLKHASEMAMQRGYSPLYEAIPSESVTEQEIRDDVLDSLRGILRPQEVAVFYSYLLDTDDVDLFFKHSGDFISSMRGKNIIIPADVIALWGRFKDKLKLTEFPGVEISDRSIEDLRKAPAELALKIEDFKHNVRGIKGKIAKSRAIMRQNKGIFKAPFEGFMSISNGVDRIEVEEIPVIEGEMKEFDRELEEEQYPAAEERYRKIKKLLAASTDNLRNIVETEFAGLNEMINFARQRSLDVSEEENEAENKRLINELNENMHGMTGVLSSAVEVLKGSEQLIKRMVEASEEKVTPAEVWTAIKNKYTKSYEITEAIYNVLSDDEKKSELTWYELDRDWGIKDAEHPSNNMNIYIPYVRDGEVEMRVYRLQKTKTNNGYKIFKLFPSIDGDLTALDLFQRRLLYEHYLGNPQVFVSLIEKSGRGLMGKVPANHFVCDEWTFMAKEPDTKIRKTRIYDRYAVFGKYLIHIPSLNKGYINLKYEKSYSKIKNFPKKMISSGVQGLIKDILREGRFLADEYERLSKADKKVFDEIIEFSKLNDVEAQNFLNYKSQKSEERDVDIERFKLLRGEIISGNNNPVIIRELRMLVLKMANENAISKKDFNEIMYMIAFL